MDRPRDRTRASAVRGRRLIAWVMARPYLPLVPYYSHDGAKWSLYAWNLFRLGNPLTASFEVSLNAVFIFVSTLI
jgi:hypothetical protein